MAIEWKISAISVEYLRVRVSARENGLVVNPTGDVVEFGFTDIHVLDPTPTDWYAGTWETDGAKYYARALVGAGETIDFLEQGATYNVWLKIHDDPETPVHYVGTVYIY